MSALSIAQKTVHDLSERLSNPSYDKVEQFILRWLMDEVSFMIHAYESKGQAHNWKARLNILRLDEWAIRDVGEADIALQNQLLSCWDALLDLETEMDQAAGHPTRADEHAKDLAFLRAEEAAWKLRQQEKAKASGHVKFEANSRREGREHRPHRNQTVIDPLIVKEPSSSVESQGVQPETSASETPKTT